MIRNNRGVALLHVLIVSAVLALMVAMLMRLSLGKFVTYHRQKTDFHSKQLLESVHHMVESCLANQPWSSMDTSACNSYFSPWTPNGSSYSANVAIPADGTTYNFTVQWGSDQSLTITCSNCL